jgi:aminoglycoside phosphotransferase (APT) family kinase protein
MDVEQLRTGLERFIADEVGSSAKLGSLTESDGHAGLTFLFDIVERGGSTQGFVIKLPPKGVRRKGNTDVYRQAPLLRALHAASIPVPRVPWAFDENDWFDLPFVVMERLPGRVFFPWDPPAIFDRSKAQSNSLWEQCVRALSRIHQFDWQRHLPDWETPQTLESQIRQWERIYAQAPERDWIAAAEACERTLLDALPGGEPTGLFHGDYQPGNVLYHEGVLSGIIDWELSGIGAQLLDVGWMMMSADESNGSENWHPIHPLPPAEIRRIYESEMGRAFDAIPWYKAFAEYRMGCIACLNVKLHRKGQRRDPVWENIALSVPAFFSGASRIA